MAHAVRGVAFACCARGRALLAAAVWLALCPLAWSTPAGDAQPPIDIAAAGPIVLPDEPDDAAVLAALLRAAPRDAQRRFDEVSGTGEPVWLRFDLRLTDGQRRWFLEVPLVRLQRATLYWQDADGGLRRQQAGVAVPIGEWSFNDRFPVFRLPAQHASPAAPLMQAYVLRLDNTVSFRATPRLVDDERLLLRRHFDTLLIGGFIGLALLALAYSTAQALVRRDAVYGWFAVHVAAMLLLQTVLTGMLRQSPAGQWPAAMELLRILAPIGLVASAVQLIRQTLSRPILGRLAHWLASVVLLAGALLAAVFWWLPAAPGWTLYNLYLLASLSIAGMMLWRTRGRGLANVRWFAFAFTALAASAAAPLLSNFGIVPQGLWTGRLLLCGAAVELGVLLYALSLNSDTEAARPRPVPPLQRDQVTGFLGPQAIEGQVNTLLVSHRRSGQCGALILLQITNSRELVYQYGAQVNSLVLQAAARCVRQIVRTPDVPMRSGDMRLALLLRRTASRQEVLGVVERIIDMGLRHSPELPAGERLRMVAAVAYLPEDVQRSTRSLIRELGHLLDRQHEGSALRVRELRREPAETAALLHGAALGGSTMAHGLDLELPDAAAPPAALSATPPLSRPPADPVATPASASETVTATSTTSARQTMAMLAHVVAPRETDTPAA